MYPSETNSETFSEGNGIEFDIRAVVFIRQQDLWLPRQDWEFFNSSTRFNLIIPLIH